jgi:hypothetical protein
MKKVILLLGLSFFASIVFTIGCGHDPIDVKWNSANANTIEISNDSAISFKYVMFPKADTLILDKGELGFVLKLEATPIAALLPKQQFIKSAYAWSYTQKYILQNRIDSIIVISLRDFDSMHPANSKINDLFKVRYKDKFESFQYVIDDDTYNLNYKEKDNEYSPATTYNFETKMLQKPTIDSLVQFKFHIYASTGTAMIVKTNLVLIK